MAEADLWANMRKHVKNSGHFERIENAVGVGRPDVNYCVRAHEGNIELKWAAQWPKLPETPLPLPHYTAQQRLWHYNRLRAGGRVYVLLQVEQDYMLIDAEWARKFLGVTATRSDIHRVALFVAKGKFPTDQLLTELTRG